MLPTEISRLVGLSKEEHQQIEDLQKIIKLNMKSLEICLQESPAHLQCIQTLKHLVEEIDILADENQELEGDRLIMEQIQTEDLQVRQQRIQDYEAIIEDKRSLLITKEDNVRRLTVPRSANMQPNTQITNNEVLQCQALQKHLNEETVRLSKLQKEVLAFRQRLADNVSRMKDAVLSSMDSYQRFINSRDKSLMLQRPKAMKLAVLEYSDMHLAAGTSNKPQLWFQERLAGLRNENRKLIGRLKQEIELTTFISKDTVALREAYEKARMGEPAEKVKCPALERHQQKKTVAALDDSALRKKPKRQVEEWETRRST